MCLRQVLAEYQPRNRSGVPFSAVFNVTPFTVQSHLKTGNSHMNFYMRLAGAFNCSVSTFSWIFLTVDVFHLEFQCKVCL